MDKVQIVSLLQRVGSTNNLDTKHDLLVEAGVLDAYCGQIAVGLSTKNLCEALRISERDLESILFRFEHSQNRILKARLVALSRTSINVLSNMDGLSMDKETANAARHHKAILDAAIKVTTSVDIDTDKAGIVVNNVVQVGSNANKPKTPKLLEEVISDADIA